MARELPAASPEQINLVRTLFAERIIPEAANFEAAVESVIAEGKCSGKFATVLIDSFKRLPLKTEGAERNILLDRINSLIKFDETGRDCEEAMALMARHQVDAEELNARTASADRPIYHPVH